MKHKRILFWALAISAILHFVVLSVAAQTGPAKNPRGVAFICPDHSLDDQHEIDIIRESDGAVIATLLAGDPALNATGEVEVFLNVQPYTFGQYRFGVRAVAGLLKSETALSEVWERVPGKPSNIRVQ